MNSAQCASHQPSLSCKTSHTSMVAAACAHTLLYAEPARNGSAAPSSIDHFAFPTSALENGAYLGVYSTSSDVTRVAQHAAIAHNPEVVINSACLQAGVYSYVHPIHNVVSRVAVILFAF